MAYKTWPFQPFRQQYANQIEDWWAFCHVPSMAESLLLNSPHWVILEGVAGSGKSVALASMVHHVTDAAFVVSYPPSRWPGARQALRQDESSHLRQMMANAALALRDYLKRHPQEATKLSDMQRDFVRWLVERHLSKRIFDTVIRGLPAELTKKFENASDEDFFPSVDDPLDVQGQIDELAYLVKTFGFTRVVFVIDIQAHDEHMFVIDHLANLFGWMELMHHPGFSVITAVPTNLLQKSNIEMRAYHRVRRIFLEWSIDQCRQIAEKHLRLAMGDNEDIHLSSYVTESVLVKMGQVIEEEYGSHVPDGWVALSEVIFHLMKSLHLSLPLQEKQFPIIKQAFFSRHMPLRLDMDAQGVWRGPRFIALDEKLLEFLHLLLHRHGHPVNWEDQQLRLFAGSPDNLYSIASRTRKIIEPFPKKPLYLLNRRGSGGYWLENYTDT